MSDNEDLPGGARRSADQASAPITQSERHGEGAFIVQAPELIGIECQIQHPLQPGDVPEPRKGMCGCGILMTDDGPKFLIQLKHPDGSSMVAIMEVEDFLGWTPLWLELPRQAEAVMRPTRGQG